MTPMTPENPAAPPATAAGAGARAPSRVAPGAPAARPLTLADAAPVTGARPGARTWVIEYPPGTPIPTANDRGNRYQRNKAAQALKAVTIQLAQQVYRLPPLGRVLIAAEYVSPPRLRRDRHPLASARVEDHDNLFPARKAAVDGLVKAGVLPKGDAAKRVGEATCRLLPGTHPRGLFRLVITEVDGD